MPLVEVILAPCVFVVTVGVMVSLLETQSAQCKGRRTLQLESNETNYG